MSAVEVFDMDGSEHERGEDCICQPSNCDNCLTGYVHYQGVYGGFLRECDRCGWPDADSPRPDITPQGDYD